MFANTGKVDDAIAAFQYGVDVAPKDETLRLNLARLWVQRGSRDKASEVLRDFLRRSPGNATAERALRALETP